MTASVGTHSFVYIRALSHLRRLCCASARGCYLARWTMHVKELLASAVGASEELWLFSQIAQTLKSSNRTRRRFGWRFGPSSSDFLRILNRFPFQKSKPWSLHTRIQIGFEIHFGMNFVSNFGMNFGMNFGSNFGMNFGTNFLTRIQ